MKSAKAFLFVLASLFVSCSELEKAEDFFEPQSDRQRYKKENQLTDELFQIWESRLDQAFKDSLEIELPYTETGELKPRNFAIYSYETYLMPGEVLQATIETDSSATLIFSELYKATSTGKKDFEQVSTGDPQNKLLRYEIREKGLYKLVLQPEIEAHTHFTLRVDKQPAYIFPVSGGKNADIGSYWGDIRDGGNRNHKGIDIFANRGTPVLAAVDGRVSFTGEKGLGGKQVWLRDRKRKQSLYYAHLDSIKPDLNKVAAGDTLGFVGNTGNARTTPPHLHFGIYRRGEGAIDPLGFVYQTEDLKEENRVEELATHIMVQTEKANLRNKPANSNSSILKKGLLGEVLLVQGKAADWFHVRDSLDRSMYIHESLVKPVY